VGQDNRALIVWSIRSHGLWAVVDPAQPEGAVQQAWPLSLVKPTVDPPAVTPVPGGYVRGWTEKTDIEWALYLQWTDLDGVAIGEPIEVTRGSGASRGARPQLASNVAGDVALAWRVKPTRTGAAEGAWLQIFRGGQPLDLHRLDPDQGDRPTVEATPDGWLVAWEEASELSMAVKVQRRTADGAPADDVLVASDSEEIPAGRANLAVRPNGQRSGVVTWEEVHLKRGEVVQRADVRARTIDWSEDAL
jgi:hypothetical protein